MTTNSDTKHSEYQLIAAQQKKRTGTAKSLTAQQMSERVVNGQPKSFSQYHEISSQVQSNLHLLPVVGERDEEFNNDVIGGADIEDQNDS